MTRAALIRAFAGRSVRPPYTMSDLAGDAVGLLDHLGLDSAHVVGVSMGGMIAQTMAIEHPGRVRSLTSVMSTTGKRSVGWQHPRLLPVLVSPSGSAREAYVARSTLVWGLIGSPDFPPTPEDIRDKALTTYDRGVSASGVLRQMMAVLTQPNRGPRLRSLTIPALVVHGTADRMVHASGGRATAAAVPGAELLLVEGMGHDLPVRAVRDLRRRHPEDGGPRRLGRPFAAYLWAATSGWAPVAAPAARRSPRGMAVEAGRRRPVRRGPQPDPAVERRWTGSALVGETLPGLGVEDVHVLRVGGDVDRVTLLTLSRPVTRTMTLPGVPSTSEVP